jgi:hypothetical protein
MAFAYLDLILESSAVCSTKLVSRILLIHAPTLATIVGWVILRQLRCALPELLACSVEVLAGLEFEVAQVAADIHDEVLLAHGCGGCCTILCWDNGRERR